MVTVRLIEISLIRSFYSLLKFNHSEFRVPTESTKDKNTSWAIENMGFD